MGPQTTKIHPRKSITQFPKSVCPPQINFSILLNMSQPSLNEKIDDEQLLGTAPAFELEDVKKTVGQLKLEKPKPTNSGPFSLNMEFFTKKNFKGLDSIVSRLEELQSSEQHRDWHLYKIFWIFEIFPVIFNNGKLFEETKIKNDTDSKLARDFCSTAFLSKPYGYSFFIRAFRYGCGPALGKSMSITINLIAGPLDDTLICPLKEQSKSVFLHKTILF